MITWSLAKQRVQSFLNELVSSGKIRLPFSQPVNYPLAIIERRQEDGSFTTVRLIELKRGDVFKRDGILFIAGSDAYYAPEYEDIARIDAELVGDNATGFVAEDRL